MSTANSQSRANSGLPEKASLQHPSIAAAIEQAGKLAAKSAGSFKDEYANHYANTQLLRSNSGKELLTAERLLDDLQEGVYKIDAKRLQRVRKGIERRAIKDRLSDRRAKLRFDASGQVQRDRRSANRIANLACIRTAQQKSAQ